MDSEPEELVLSDAESWQQWPHDHRRSQGAWLVLAKKGTVEPSRLSYEQAREEALCHGWIEGRVQRHDAATYRQHFGDHEPHTAAPSLASSAAIARTGAATDAATGL